jgi:hypothetical protein
MSGMRKVYQAFRVFVWSALACQRFGRTRPVAALFVRRKTWGVRPSKAKALTGQHTPKIQASDHALFIKCDAGKVYGSY